VEPITASAARLAGSSLLRLQSDERLARLAALDNHAAFETIVRRYRPELLRASGRVLSDARAEDAVQQAFLKAHEALLRNGPPDRLRPWLHRIAFNASVDIFNEEAMTELPPEELLEGSESAAEIHERRERLASAFAAIEALPEGQRRAIIARELEGRSHEEIATELGLSGGAARQLIHRARAGVRSAVTAVTPIGLIERLAPIGGAQSAPIADIAAGGLAGGAAAKVAVAAIVAGGAIGGAALVGPLERSDGERESRAGAGGRGAHVASVQPNASGGREGMESAGGSGGPGPTGAGEAGGSGPNGGGEPNGDSNEGPGGGGGNGGSGGNSGPGGGGDDDGDDSEVEVGDDNSGSGSSGSGSSGSGSGSSGSGSSGSGSSGSGSSGSGSSGSGSSGSGSGDFDSSGSGSSGSDSGSGSSGSGSDDVPEPDEISDDELD
jgi:RNA polymerase sigma factor (sigma-70 family)